jgi:hypothetical protein
MLSRALETGEKNRQTLVLLQNWCAHAKLERGGGVGLIHAMTRDPVGLLGVSCDYAPAGGMYAWDLAAVALEFHDRNCVGCPYRKPVGLPNLSSLLAERDAAQRQRSQQEEAAAVARDNARAKRRAARDALRATLDPVPATVIDQLSALDGGTNDTTADALVETARLAPDAFPPPLVDYLFELLETSQAWAAEPVLRVLLQLKADPARLARCAMQMLRYNIATEAAAEAVVAVLDHVEVRAIAGVTPALIELALPMELPIPGGDGPAHPEGLLALHTRHARTVESALEDLLAQQDLDKASLGARGVAVVASNDSAAALRLARAAVSKLARSKSFEDRYGSGQPLHALRGAIADAYRADPDATEKLMQSFSIGATGEGRARLFSVYHEVLGRPFDKREGDPTPAEHAVFLRLLRAITETQPKEVESEIQSIFQSSARERTALATQNIDGLLGAALVLDDRLRQLEAEAKTPAVDFLASLERMGRRTGATQLQKNLVGWAAEAAAGDAAATREYLLLLQSLPEDRDSLRAVMVGRFKKLIVSPATLGLILPALYGALVGASAGTRGAAAKVVGEIPSRLLDDAPRLLLEAFVALLWDPYQYVLASAVSALERTPLPPPFESQVGDRLLRLVAAYADELGQSEFLVDCVGLVLRRHLTEDQRAGRAGAWIIEVLARHAPKAYARELSGFGRLLATQPTFGTLVVAALRDQEALPLRGEDVIQALRGLAAPAIAAVREDLIAIGEGAPALDPEVRLAETLIEVFTSAGDWTGAQAIADAKPAKFTDTRRELTRRLSARLAQASVWFERAVAEGRQQDAARLAGEWRGLRADLDAALA